MTYDLRGWDQPTGHHTCLYDPVDAPVIFSADRSVKMLEGIGIPKDKMVLGAAFYSRMWKNVPNINNGMNQPSPTGGGFGPGYTEISLIHEKSGRFISKLCDALWAILEETTWVMHAHRGHNPGNPTAMVPPVYNETDLHGVDLVSAGTGAVLAAALLLHRDAFGELSPIFVERMEYELEKKIIKPFISFHHSWSGAY
jgi:hypothetical protein